MRKKKIFFLVKKNRFKFLLGSCFIIHTRTKKASLTEFYGMVKQWNIISLTVFYVFRFNSCFTSIGLTNYLGKWAIDSFQEGPRLQILEYLKLSFVLCHVRPNNPRYVVLEGIEVGSPTYLV